MITFIEPKHQGGPDVKIPPSEEFSHAQKNELLRYTFH